MIILGIETSCDETAASVIDGQGGAIKVLSNVVSSQIEIHKKYYGVVPEIAAREHILNILPVINEALEKAGIKKEEVQKRIDALSVTIGPGLITSLIVGIETAKTLAYAWNLPLIGINHIEGHIYGNFIKPESKIKFPTLVLTVSGGHTMLVLMKGHGKFQTIGETRDDAAGEAFDKAAKLLNLGYPGGPIVSKTAAEFVKTGKKSAIVLPRPMINSGDFDFSFSGLKTALLYKIQKDKDWQNKIPEYCYEFERAVVETLISKTVKTARKYKIKTMMLAGGVSANSVLRRDFLAACLKENLACQIPPPEYTTDNAAMIAVAGYWHARRKDFTPWKKIKVDCNLELK